jgi:putative oxidoreductase
MKSFFNFLEFDFVPRSTDLALLVLRLWLGLTLLINHGWGKLAGFSTMSRKFPDLLGFGSATTLGLSTFAELFCAALVVLGLFTRFGALVLVCNFAAAFFLAHGHALSGPHSGELPFLYLAGFATLFIAGGGRFAFGGKSAG